jgi:uroporphyrinogen decarboxylase
MRRIGYLSAPTGTTGKHGRIGLTGKERLLKALRREQPDHVPTFEWFIDDGVGEALTGSRDPVDVVEALDIDGINIRADYAREDTGLDTYRDEWGTVRKLTGDCIAAVLEHPIEDIAAHRDYTFPDPAASHRFLTLERALQRFGDRRAVILNLRDGFSDMRDLLGYENALIQFMVEPELFRELLDRSVDYNLELARRVRDRYGVDIVATTDDVANDTGLLFRPEQYLETIGPSFQRVMRGYKDLGYRIIKHCDGDVTSVVDFWVECGIDCLDPIDPGAGMRLEAFRERHGDRICLKGNVDCKGALCDGREEDVENEVRDCLDKAGRVGYILSSSNTIHRGVKPENYRAMLETLRRWG